MQGLFPTRQRHRLDLILPVWCVSPTRLPLSGKSEATGMIQRALSGTPMAAKVPPREGEPCRDGSQQERTQEERVVKEGGCSWLWLHSPGLSHHFQPGCSWSYAIQVSSLSLQCSGSRVSVRPLPAEGSAIYRNGSFLLETKGP